jgi:hypothetical protein
MIHIS